MPFQDLVNAYLCQVVIVIDDVIKQNILLRNFWEVLESCSIVLAHVLADIAIFVKHFCGNKVFTRFGVCHLSFT